MLRLTTLIVVVAMMAYMACAVSLKRHSLTVYENGTTFKQTLNIDVKNRLIYIHVPGHRNIPDCRYMYEYPTGRLLKCFRSLKRCLLSNFDTKTVPDPAEEEIDVKKFARQHISPRREAGLEKTINQDTVVTEKINDLSVISPAMRKAVGGYALYREEPLPTDAKILNGTSNANDIKQKRQLRSCQNGHPVVRYLRTYSRSCNRVVFCSNPRNRWSCKEEHYTGQAYFQCVCCRHETTPKTCRFGCLKLWHI